MNKDKISITLNDTLMRFIDLARGDVPRSKFIENYLKDSLGLFEAVWIFLDELSKVKKSELAYAHVPLSTPLHRHEGLIDVQKDGLDFYDKDLNKLFSINKGEIRQLSVKYDKDFKRFVHSNVANPPMRIASKDKKVYLFTRQIGASIFKGENNVIRQTLL
ncbi:MAG: hypothetical protein M1348_00390 [Candidatus Parvarchaeota archaeon]|jgi:hypothetical protein|nr:hypothetical protein [Candidatus Parvarchaeota archaeon]MCL5101056.1 hypothetical protein [Candidatus Parvarchaeota archaeon]